MDFPSDLPIDASDILYKTLFLAVEQSPMAIVITDADANIVYANPVVERLTGFSIDEIRGKNPRLFNSGEQGTEFYEILWSTITSGRSWSGEFHNKRKDGSLYWESAIISPVSDNDGTIHYYFALKSDVTALRTMEEELKEQREELSQFAHMMAHDLRTPLHVIRGYAELMDDSDGLSEKIVRKADEMHAFVDQSLRLADAGKVAGIPTNVDLQHLVDKVCGETIPKGVAIDIGPMPIVYADPQKTFQVFQNILSNAVEHAHPTALSITARATGAYQLIEVTDNGGGIPSGMVEKVFEQGFSTSPNGTGFGMAIVKKIMRAMGGSVSLSSDEGKGTTVSLLFPVRQ